ncbi:DUF3151 domain-containing protein [Isoptericola aurantiacus]|uniref:DUF3151 domain-containing protein n=1 Tax=Isoptericola aurantiacus TaxID=3377839 RepID=UPI00383AE58D
MTPTSPGENLLGGPPPTLLPDDHAEAREGLETGQDPARLAADHPSASLVWAVLAEQTLTGEDDVVHSVTAYAYARTGYHRGLDALRRAGWRGQGPVPADHVPNQGFLRAVLALSEAARRIAEDAEAERCRQLLVDSGTSSEAVAALR